MSTEPRPVGAAHRSPAPAPARTRARPARPLPAFTAATAGAGLLLAAAAGLGVPRLDAGVAAVLLTATAAVAGVACLVTGVLALRRALGRWALVAAPLWLVVLLAAAGCLAVALAATHPPHPAAQRPPREAETVTMTAADGVVLAGWYLPSTSGAAVVLRHGSGSTSAAVVAHAQALHAAGYGVLATDARGHGASGGRGMDLGWSGELDIRAAVDLLVHRPDVDPGRIGVVGLSMGGEESLGAAGEDARIRAVVAEGATGRTRGDKTWLADEYGLAGRAQGVLDAVTYGLVDVLTPGAPPRTLAESVRRADGTPVLLLAAGTEPDEQSVAGRLAATAPERVEVWTVDGAPHTGALAADPAGWREHVVGFLDRALAAPG
ncbi:alpha/beta hydrolase [Cellulomonas olei]|uniref:alpha/beta hydrolase n=1 Tax=Cellulomonas sp. P4 TaxID=3142533 RepID=UPI0031BBBA96